MEDGRRKMENVKWKMGKNYFNGFLKVSEVIERSRKLIFEKLASAVSN